MREWEQYIQFEEERNEAIHGREGTNQQLDLYPTNMYVSYSDLAVVCDCVEDCIERNRMELTHLQSTPAQERDSHDTVRIKWLQTRNRVLKHVLTKLNKEMTDYGNATQER